MADGDIIETVQVCSTPTQVALNIRQWFVTTSTMGGATVLEVAVFLESLFAPMYKAILGSDARWEGVTAQKILPLPITAKFPSTAFAGVGDLVSALLPKQSAGLITYRTLFGGRGFKGRSYVPFPVEGDNEAFGAPTAGYVGRLQTLATNLGQVQPIVGAVGTELLVPILFKRSNNTFTVIEAGLANTKWATQRRRGDYGRPNIIGVL